MGSALLVIAMQRGLFGEMPEAPEVALVVDRINDLAARARHAGAPVIWVIASELLLESVQRHGLRPNR